MRAGKDTGGQAARGARARRELLGLVLLSLLPVACGPLTFVVGIAPGDQRLTSTTVERDGRWASPRVAMVDVSGLIINANRPGLLAAGENPVSLLREKLDQAASDPRVKALILRLNTPGGTVTASDAMYREILRFRQRTGMPVIALCMDVTASGGYYVACAADTIVAYPTAITGSIGVIVQTITVKPGLARIGVHTDAIVSGPNKDMGSPLSNMTVEHRAILQGLVDDFYGRFKEVVRAARPGIAGEHWAQATDGRVFTGVEAQRVGLVDHVGDLHDALALAVHAAGLRRADLILYHRPLAYVGSPYATAGGQSPQAGPTVGTQVNLAQINLSDGLAGALLDPPVGFYYVWQPLAGN